MLKPVLFLIFIINLIPLLLFYLNGQLPDFIEQTIWFNFKIYPKYYIDTIPFQHKWWGSLAYFFTNQFYLLTHFNSGHQLFQFIINISLLVFLIKIIKTRKIKNIFLVLIIFLSIHIRQNKIIPGSPFNFGIYPLILVSISAFSLIVVDYFPSKKIILSLFTFILLSVSYKNLSPILKNSLNLEYNYHVFWSPRVQLGQLISSHTNSSDNILIYPHDVDLYYFSNRLPPDRFVYWFPWIDEVGEYKKERQQTLSSNPPKLICIGNLDFQGQKDYYFKFFPDLTSDYTQIANEPYSQKLYVKSF